MMQAADSLIHNDSLRRAVEQLFLEGARFGSPEAADNLQTAVASVSAADLFGPGSALAANAAPASAVLPLTTNPLFQCLVLLLTVIYFVLVTHHSGHLYALFTRIPLDSGNTSDIRTGSSYSHFLNLTIIIGLLLAGTLSVKCIDLLLPSGILPYQVAAGVSLIATSALLLLVVTQGGMLLLIGVVTLTRPFIHELNYLRRSAFTLLTIITAPILLCYILTPGNSGQVWMYIIIAEVIIILILFLRKTLLLFISKKISILHWFLYLCIVEIFPVSLLWLLITRQ